MKPYGISTEKLLAVREREAARLGGMLSKSKALHDRAKASQPCGVPMAWMVGLYEHLPMYVESASGSWFTDVDGNRYLDMNQADVASFMGYGSHAITNALAERNANGGSFLPTPTVGANRHHHDQTQWPAVLAIHRHGVAVEHGSHPHGPRRHRPRSHCDV